MLWRPCAKNMITGKPRNEHLVLPHTYRLTRREVYQIIGPAIQYRIPKTAGGITEVVAMIPKAVLKSLPPGP
jgi:hypothetical protein